MTTLTLSPSPPSLPSQEPQALSEDAQAIFEILAIDVSEFQSFLLAERLQMEEAIAFSAGEVAPSSSLPSSASSEVEETEQDESNVAGMTQLQEDLLVALNLTKEDAQLEADATLARELGNAAAPPHVALDRMVAEQLAAGERKIAVDRTYAEHLRRANEKNLDIDRLGDAEKELGIERVQGIINAQDPNSKGKGKVDPEPSSSSSASAEQPAGSTSKGKGKAVDVVFEPVQDQDASLPSIQSVLSTSDPFRQCGICWDACRPVANPLKSSAAATSSSQVPYGIQLACGHSYCLSDATSYLCGYLDGDGGSLMAVFPICCPECQDGRDAFCDEIAEAILDKRNMDRWWEARILDSIPKMYCTNKKCATLVVGPDAPNATQAQCPLCEEQMCVQCRTRWHAGLSCEEFQALPEEVKSIEDRQLFGLAEGKKWGRCPKCRAVVERSQGCNHITCRCRQEFCYSCGTEWGSKGSCPKGCDLFYVPPDIPGIGRAVPQPRARPVFGSQVGGPVQTWVAAHGGLVGRDLHLYTSSIVASRTCPTCLEKFATDPALFEHLDTATHPVHFHCGMIFPSASALEEHHRSSHGGA